MITVTGHRQYQAWQDKEMPPVEMVRDGVFSIPVPFPGNPMRYTLAYLMVGDGESVLVDPGWDSDAGWAALLEGIARSGVGVEDITGIVATHFHPDHLGMVERLRRASQAWVGLGENELLPARWVPDVDEFVAADRSQFSAWGVPPDRLSEVCFSADSWTSVASPAPQEVRLRDGELLPVAGLRLRVLSTPGHTPGHICLVDEKNQLILTGDHVLPRITPHVSLEARGMDDPLACYFDSLDVMAAGADMEVLPAHEYRFRGLPLRVKQLRAHGLERSAEVIEVLETKDPQNVWSVARELTWSRGFDSLRGFTLRLALAETASHLVYLRARGRQLGLEVPRGAPASAR